jgi:hypothetical protein
MSKTHSALREVAEDIFFGQIALIWARWFLIAAGAIIAIGSAESMEQLTVSILVVVGLMAINFFTHGRYLTEKPANRLLLIAMSVLDIFIITVLIMFWPGQTGLNSHFFILYFPLLFAFALVFPPSLTVLFSLGVLGLYAGSSFLGTDPGLMFSTAGFELLTTRLITLGAMGGLGALYYRRQRASLRAATAKISPIAR